MVGCVRLEFVRFPELFFFLTVKDTIESISYYQAHLISDVSLVLEVLGTFNLLSFGAFKLRISSVFYSLLFVNGGCFFQEVPILLYLLY